MHGDDEGDSPRELPDMSGNPRRRRDDRGNVVHPGFPEWYAPRTLEALRGLSEALPRALGALEVKVAKAEDDIATLKTALYEERIATWKLRVALGVLGGVTFAGLLAVAVLRPDLAKGIGALLGAAL
jgi:hypothetical protein